ncbi:hypothetical protein ABVK25_001935 [Lepraria finkii]|uniref:Peptidase A1 domain-containing protein n=1 Tax=Lepraria finkii TaxID=1340010 RepID=A0ABR4BIA1_9LECA
MANSSAAPIVVPPSEAWDGNDGPWSTFNIHVGTPPQPARVLVSTASGESWVISANKTQGGCLSTDPSTCAQSRGTLFNLNASSTWKDQGIFGVGLEVNLPDYVGNYDNGDYGLDTLGVGLPGSGPSLDNMVVAALATKDFYLGYLGVTIHPTNFSEFNDPHPTFLSTLKSSGKIPSLSYGYSAGAQYRFKKALGTLTLGGYDASKFTPNEVDFLFAADISRDLVAGLQEITFSDSKTQNEPLLKEGILTFIDATVPHIWLPQDACTLFENAFGLTYNSKVDRYLVNNTLHTQLQAQNASVSFVLGNQINGGATVTITLPYKAFDLQVGPPIVDTTQNYFPLRRAANSTQYTMGRTFLQESYLIVNYEQSNFSVSQNIWEENTPSQILSIDAANITTPTKINQVQQTTSKSISTGAIIGIAVPVVALIIVAAIAIFFFIRRQRRRRREKEKREKIDDIEPFQKPEMDATSKVLPGELYAEGKAGELDSSSKIEMQSSDVRMSAYDKNIAEMEGTRGVVEMEGTKGGAEMEGSRQNAETEGSGFAPVEMYAGDHGLYELPSPETAATEGSDVPSPLGGSRRNRRSRIASWNRRRKPTPIVPRSGSNEISPDSAEPNRRSGGAGMWTGRGPRDTASTQDVSSPTSESSRSRQRNRGDLLTQRLDHASRRHPPPDISSPSDSSRELPRRPIGSTYSRNTALSSTSDGSRERLDSGADAWNRRFGSSPRRLTPNDISSPSNRSRQGRERLGSAASGGSGGVNSPSNYQTPSGGSLQPPGNFF